MDIFYDTSDDNRQLTQQAKLPDRPAGPNKSTYSIVEKGYLRNFTSPKTSAAYHPLVWAKRRQDITRRPKSHRLSKMPNPIAAKRSVYEADGAGGEQYEQNDERHGKYVSEIPALARKLISHLLYRANDAVGQIRMPQAVFLLLGDLHTARMLGQQGIRRRLRASLFPFKE